MLKKHGLARIKALFQVSILCLEERTQFLNETIVQQLINLAYIHIYVYSMSTLHFYEKTKDLMAIYTV